ncbi:ATP synthase regulation protein NCA2-domain-containing protein [Dipodascopsis tothii]|uniref:ATP synthase regulation protein NCA2-domain-containing protein n=1 Tax=Dipodascopsis tothii TaxID=44089 RepID=UPI0034CF2A5F
MSSIVSDRVGKLFEELEAVAAALPAAAVMPGTPGGAGITGGAEQAYRSTVLDLLNRLLVRPNRPRPGLQTVHETLAAFYAAQKARATGEPHGVDAIAVARADYGGPGAGGQGDQVEWLVVAAAAIHVYGHVVEDLLQQTLPLAEDVYYWESVASTPANVLLYSVQTAPARGLRAARAIVGDARGRLAARPSVRDWLDELKRAFHGQQRAAANVFTASASVSGVRRALSLAPIYAGVHRRQEELRALRTLQATALGLLVGRGMSVDRTNWQDSVTAGVALLEGVVADVAAAAPPDTLAARATAAAVPAATPGALALRVLQLVDERVPGYRAAHAAVLARAARPGPLTRLWPGLLAGAVFGTAALRAIFNRRADLAEWAREAAAMAADFWANWVVEPVRNIAATIRHDAGAQVAIVGRQSLQADMASLERMVVDFTADTAGGLGDEAVEDLRARVREGDLSSVLRIYEQELQRPLASVVRGQLVRTLLIQVQKTKVDVELAATGIDKLLKSQELVFGVVAALPSALACYGVLGWVHSVYTGKGLRLRGRQGQIVARVLGNVDRILTVDPGPDTLSYTSHGHLLCEASVLRTYADIVPTEVRADYLRDLGDLENIGLGLVAQRRTLDRVWRLYQKYL